MARTPQWLLGAENTPGQPASEETRTWALRPQDLPSATTTSSKEGLKLQEGAESG